jgi:hypothetical protein
MRFVGIVENGPVSGSNYNGGGRSAIANHGDRIDLPLGAVPENKIVSGNVRFLDH